MVVPKKNPTWRPGQSAYGVCTASWIPSIALHQPTSADGAFCTWPPALRAQIFVDRCAAMKSNAPYCYVIPVQVEPNDAFRLPLFCIGQPLLTLFFFWFFFLFCFCFVLFCFFVDYLRVNRTNIRNAQNYCERLYGAPEGAWRDDEIINSIIDEINFGLDNWWHNWRPKLTR